VFIVLRFIAPTQLFQSGYYEFLRPRATEGEALFIVNRNANRTPLSEFEVPGLVSKLRVFDDLTVL